MKALILNSGMGKRMGIYTSEHPKCMTQLSDDGETILSRQLKLLKQNKIEDVVITTGMFDKVLIKYCEELDTGLNITFVNNPLYDSTNYIYSIYLATDKLNDDIMLMHGDLVYTDDVLKKLLNEKDSCMVVSGNKTLPEKDFKAVIDEQGFITKIGIEFFDNAKAAQPLYKLNICEWKMWLSNINKFCKAGDTGCYAENAFNSLNGECKIRAIDVGDLLCEEIDTPEDYKKVRYEIKKLG